MTQVTGIQDTDKCHVCFEILDQFKDYGNTASYHYADDTTSEWGAGKRAECNALELFDDNPTLQDDMREIAKGFLWSLSMKRPENDIQT